MSNTNRPDADRLSADLECVLCRMDEKGETLDDAIEAVTGNGSGEYFKALKNYAQGKPVKWH